ERRRVQHHQAEALARPVESPQLVEGVAGRDLGSISAVVQLEIFPRPGDGLRRRLQAYRTAGSGHERVAGKAGGVGERVEDVTPHGMGSDPQSVLTLIEVEAGLVALAERD